MCINVRIVVVLPAAFVTDWVAELWMRCNFIKTSIFRRPPQNGYELV